MKGYEESMLRNLKRLGRISFWAWLALAGPYAHAAPDTLDMGVFPYMSTRALLDLYQPVRVYLSHELGKSVTLFTAQSFKAFTNETQQGIYDIVVTAPHFAKQAMSHSSRILGSYRVWWSCQLILRSTICVSSKESALRRRISSPS
jgi:phosphonate transport system substrate-binding protein